MRDKLEVWIAGIFSYGVLPGYLAGLFGGFWIGMVESYTPFMMFEGAIYGGLMGASLYVLYTGLGLNSKHKKMVDEVRDDE